ncbi:MAG: hypothetical protein Q9215_007448 [Flavoplaca cf. flavocitrina]
MNAHGPHVGSKPTGSIPSPSSSSEMSQCLSAREEGRLQEQGQSSMPLRGPRPSFCHSYIADSMWTDEADISGLNMPQAQRSRLTSDMWSDMFGAQDSQQPAWLPSLTNEDDTSSAAQAGSQSYITNQIPSVAYGEPRPSSPASHENEDEDEDEDEDLSTESVEDEAHSPGDALKTAAERRAEKRKSKRFRLTHNQTRFLMSEFTRQAHPNAAQRERLSREIPGISPRQVQVWFQNRRAKLKRFTIDDQESMLKSRALPAGFNTTQALNYAHDAPRHRDLGGPSSFFHSSHPEYELRRSLILGELGCAQAHDDNISPTSAPSNFVDASFPGSETLSPNSPLSDRSHFYTPPTSQGTSPRVSSPSTRSSSFPTTDQTTWRRGGSPLQQRLVRSRAGSSAFPVSYATKLAEHDRHHAILSTQANQPHHDSQHTFSGNTSGSDPNQLYTTPNVREFFDTVWANPNMDGVWPPSSSVDTNGHRMYGPPGAPLQTQHNLPTRQVHSAPLSAPPEFYLPDWTAQYPPGEAYFPTAFDYGQGSSADQVWSPSQGFPPYQAQTPQHSLFQGHAMMSSNSDAGNAAPRPEHIEPWPEQKH